MTESRPLAEYLASQAPVAGHRPWPRIEVDESGWRGLLATLADADWSLVGLWAEPARVHAAFRDDAAGTLGVVSLPCSGGRFPALSPVRPAAQRLERLIRDMFGLIAEGTADGRPWLDHGRWPVRTPLAERPEADGGERADSDYRFLPVEGEGLHQIPVGPVHAGIIEPGHFRFHCNGETVVRLEERLGYVHKGTERLMQGCTPLDAVKFASRISGDSAVAHSLAFARAVEAATETHVPERAHWIRALMAELERIANHLGDIGAICNDASFVFMQAHLTVMREQVLRIADRAFGHRLMMDRIVPGGVARDMAAGTGEAVTVLAAELKPRFARLMTIYDNKASLIDRTSGTGVTPARLVHRFAAGGYVGRAASRGLDARRTPSYPPYNELDFAVPLYAEGDVNARLWVRAREIEASLGLLVEIVRRLPGGPIATEVQARAGEGMALVEAFRGEIMTWVSLDAAGRIRRCHVRDPSWFQWPLLEIAVKDNIVADFPLCNKSFNCSYSGHDL